jgi:hypothetical protein
LNTATKNKVILAGALHSLCSKNLFSTVLAPLEEQEEEIQLLEETVGGIGELFRSIGIEPAGYRFPIKLDVRNPVATAWSWTSETLLLEQVREMYGGHAANTYHASRLIAFSYFLCNLMDTVRKIYDGPFASSKATAKTRRFIETQAVEAHRRINEIGPLLKKSQEAIRFHLGDTIADACVTFSMAAQKTSSDKTLRRFRLLCKETDRLLNALLPDWPNIYEDISRARELRKELNNLAPGRKHWRAYENLCIKVLHFLFVPPFRRIHVQSRTADGHEIRDAVLSNNNLSGFWGLLRTEFDAKHAVCEFKNGKDGQSKEALNQLRIYLSKRAIGRFGMFFVRQSPSRSLLHAQRAAYDQNILILIIDDKLVSRLLSARAFARSVDSVLEDEKTKLELGY